MHCLVYIQFKIYQFIKSKDLNYMAQEAEVQINQSEVDRKKHENLQNIRIKSKQSTERLFKILVIFVILGVGIFFPNLIVFREYCQNHKIYMIPLKATIWAILSFFFSWGTRQIWSKFCQKYFMGLLHPKYATLNIQQRTKKLYLAGRQAYDFIFHSTTTVIIIIFFRKQSWFPVWTGGSSTCNDIFATYPRWSPTLNPAIQIFYFFQLGCNVYHLFEMLYLRRLNYKRTSYFELIFHHCVATSLIIFSTCYNYIPIGIMVMFVHDSSDSLRALGTAISESKYAIQQLEVAKSLNFIYLVIWVYMRIVVFPFCLIVSIYDNIPDETTDFPFVGIKLTALMLLCCGILFLHSYWLFFIATKQWRQWDENKMFREYLVTEQKLKKEKEQKLKQIKHQ